MQEQQSMIQKNIATILTRIASAQSQLPQSIKSGHKVRLVGVSKTKSVQQILQAYNAGLRHFGQNYVQQIQQKAVKLPQDIKWHFIGHLQSNKIKKVIVSNLQYLETIDRQSLAEKVQKQLQKSQQWKQRKLKIFLQVKTSQQQSKNGAQQAQVQPLFLFIKQQCPNLQFRGLMTIGKQGDKQAFTKLRQLKEKLSIKYAIKSEDFELSMGMSGDFEEAIKQGATNVRVGSLIFGARNYANINAQKQEKKENSKQKSKQKSKEKVKKQKSPQHK